MTQNVDRERAYVASLYPGKKWKQKVRKMSDAQVLAIHFREKRAETKTKPEGKEKPDVPF